MPTGLWYAGGDYKTDAAIPSSAFSAGDILTYTSASSLSRISELWPTGGKIVGIAISASTASIMNKVPFIIPNDDTEFWASADTTLTSHLTIGKRCDILFSTANNRYYVTSSANSARAVIVLGTAELDQSVQSKVKIRLLTSGAETAFI